MVNVDEIVVGELQPAAHVQPLLPPLEVVVLPPDEVVVEVGGFVGLTEVVVVEAFASDTVTSALPPPDQASDATMQ